MLRTAGHAEERVPGGHVVARLIGKVSLVGLKHTSDLGTRCD